MNSGKIACSSLGKNTLHAQGGDIPHRGMMPVGASRLDRQTKFASSSKLSTNQCENISNPKGSPLCGCKGEPP